MSEYESDHNWPPVGWQLAGRVVTEQATTGASLLAQIDIPEDHKSYMVIAAVETTADTWVDIRAYTSGGSVIPTTRTYLQIDNNIPIYNTATNGYPFAAAVAYAHTHVNMRAESIRTAPDNWRSWIYQSGSRGHLFVGSSGFENGDAIGSIRLYAGTATKAGASLEVWYRD